MAVPLTRVAEYESSGPCGNINPGKVDEMGPVSRSGELEDLLPDVSLAAPSATFRLNSDMDYVFELVRMPAFATTGSKALPSAAWTKIGASRELYATIALKEEEGKVLSVKAKKHSERLAHMVAKKEYKMYLKLWRSDIQRSIVRTPREYGEEVDDCFTPEW
ncbi:hypothetical protein CERZMDRAFT_93840 [Cercospora zeae-maydis SCOH1-5]|uniref:Uncharacterized protein n=1 Tax=Cercospora zeae-maydis SCOH1-5 TaxID=717836 RepID=A0A6A6FST6_9PEZI|nr:hypothetical protein CERZMDRAFT_93840 [Cercospora zeae-maydis SCOH1-5]